MISHDLTRNMRQSCSLDVVESLEEKSGMKATRNPSYLAGTLQFPVDVPLNIKIDTGEEVELTGMRHHEALPLV